MGYYVCFNVEGHITRILQRDPVLQEGESVIESSVNPSSYAATLNPGEWQVVEGELIRAPYWAIQSSVASGQTTVTATMINPPATEPTTATLMVGVPKVGAAVVTLPVSSGMVTLSLQLHETLGEYQVPVTVAASGLTLGEALVGIGPMVPVAVQAIPPTTSGEPYLIGPTGVGAKTLCRQVAMGLTPQTEMEVLTLSAQNLYLTTALGMQVLMEKILPWAQQSTWSPLALTSGETSALTALQTNLTTYFPGLSDIVTASGDPAMPQVSEMYAQAPALQLAAENYATWIAELGL